MTHRSVNLVQFWLALAFLSVPALSFGLAGYIYFRTLDMAQYATSYLGFLLAVTVAWALLVGHFRLDRLENLSAFRTGTLTIGKATGATMVLVLGILFFYRNIEFSRMFVVLGCFLMFVISLVVLHSFRTGLLLRHRLPIAHLRVAIIGDDDYARRVAQQLAADRLMPCEIACFISPPRQDGSSAPDALPWDSLETAVESLRCKEVIVALSLESFTALPQMLERAHSICVPVRLVLDFGISISDRVYSFNGVDMLDVGPCPIDLVPYAIAKRAFDIVFSIFVLIATSPITLLMALLIKVTSPGPVLFVQERVGLNGKPFRMLKFRTMRVQAPRISDTEPTVREDSRVTPLGRILRRTSLDELPQFFNVLKGEMSVVGPRPERAHFVNQFRTTIPDYMARHNIKCGITGWAQVNGLRGFETSIAERIQYDLEYIRRWSMVLDVKIIVLTVFSLARNAY
jgi:Undecaprenyl-phosphate glucose phosphotransferase